MAKKQNNVLKNSSNIELSKSATSYESTFNRLAVILTGALTIFSIGFYIGDFKKDLESKLEVMTAKQDCNDLVQTEKDKCAEIRKQLESQRLEELNTTIKALTIMKGGKNER